MKLQLTGRGRAVYALTKRNKRDAQAMEFFEHRDEMSEIAAKPVESPHDEHIESSAFGITDKLVESGAFVLRPTHSPVHILSRGPSPCLRITPQLEQLVVSRLLDR
jgi:hypothetical protein